MESAFFYDVYDQESSGLWSERVKTWKYICDWEFRQMEERLTSSNPHNFDPKRGPIVLSAEQVKY